MPSFRYVAVDATGKRQEGVMEAVDQKTVIHRLQAQGQLPLEARPLDVLGSARLGWRRLLQGPVFGAVAQQNFTRQLATLLHAGQPLDRALMILQELPDTAVEKKVVERIGESIRGGASLSSALEKQQGVFSRLYLNMVRAGEAGGSLAPTLERLADYLERAAALQARVINALVYPAILLVVVGAALLFLLGYVVPQFSQMYDSLSVPLPWFTTTVLWLGKTVREWGAAAVIVFGVLLWFSIRLWQHPYYRQRGDALLLRLPLVGETIAKLETARLMRTLGTLLSNGVPILSALTVARMVLGNRILAEELARAADQVRDGKSLAVALGQASSFPRLAVQMIQVGEESGALDALLLRAADTFESESARSIDRLLSALVPALTLVLSVIVGGVIVAVLVPLYDLTGAMG